MSYYPKETMSKTITFKDKDNALLDPDTTTVTILDATGESQGTPTLSQVSTGLYALDWNIPTNAAIGNWIVIIQADKGTYVSIHTDTFTVSKPT